MELTEVIEKLEQATEFAKSEIGEETVRQLKLYRCLTGSYEKMREQNLQISATANLFNDDYFKGLQPPDVIALAKTSLRARKENSELIAAIIKIQTLLEVVDEKIENPSTLDYVELNVARFNALKICKKYNPYEENNDEKI